MKARGSRHSEGKVNPKDNKKEDSKREDMKFEAVKNNPGKKV